MRRSALATGPRSGTPGIDGVVVPPLEVRVGPGWLKASPVADTGDDRAYLRVGELRGIRISVHYGYCAHRLGKLAFLAEPASSMLCERCPGEGRSEAYI